MTGWRASFAPSPLRGEGSVARSAATWQSWGEGFSTDASSRLQHRAPHPALRADLSPEGRGEKASDHP